MLSVQTNTTALSVQRFLNKSAQAQSSNQGKASSGSNIVRAADDAAGLAISNKMRADIASLRQGQKNASQGASLLQIANGATDRAVDILTRLKELASNNDLLGAAEKQFKQAEVNQLLDQLNAIATQTTVTGRAIMNGVDKALNGPLQSAITLTNTGTAAFQAASSPTSVIGNISGKVTDARVTESGGNYTAEIDIEGKTFRSLAVSSTAAASSTLTFIDLQDPQNRFNVTLGSTALTADNAGTYQNALRNSFNIGAPTSVSFTQATASSIASRTIGVAGSPTVTSNTGTTTLAAQDTVNAGSVNSIAGVYNVSGEVGTFTVVANANTAANFDISTTIGGRAYSVTNVDAAATSFALRTADGSSSIVLNVTALNAGVITSAGIKAELEASFKSATSTANTVTFGTSSLSFSTVTNTALVAPTATAGSVLGVQSAFNVSGPSAADFTDTGGVNRTITATIGGVSYSATASTGDTTIKLQNADKTSTLVLSTIALDAGSAAAALNASLTTGVTFASALNLQGGVSGTYKGATVAVVGGNFQVDLKIGNETYRGSIGGGATANTTTGSATPIVFTSQTNSNNKFSLVLGTNAPALSAENTTVVRNALDTTFGASLVSGGSLSTVSFKAAQVAEGVGAAFLKTGATTFADVVRSSSATAADTYTLTTNYIAANSFTGTAEKVLFRLQDSKGNVSETELKSESGTNNDGVLVDAGKTKTISFSNGITLNLDAASINNMSTTNIGSSDTTGIRFSVADGEATILKFQTGIASTDVLSVGLDAVNVKSLGLTGISMEDNAKAADAVDRVDAALARVNLLSANIGAQQSRLDFTMDVNATTLENYQAANSVVRDADLSAVLTDLSQATLRNNVATAILSQANQTPTQTVSRLLQGL
jgi:flagellin-like hook-associated protein FlgL